MLLKARHAAAHPSPDQPHALARAWPAMTVVCREDAAVATAAAPAVSDVELIQRMARGDALAFADFYDRYATLLFSVAQRVLGNSHEAEEVLQDAARTLWERAPLYDEALGKPVSWAVVITRHKAIDRLRVLQRELAGRARIAEATATAPPTNSAEAISQDTVVLLRRALATLPPEQRLAIDLAFFSGFTQTEIAAHLGQPLGTIKARVRRGMLAMREMLEGDL